MFRSAILRGIRNLSTATTQGGSEQTIEKTINQVTLLGRVGCQPQARGNENHPVVVFSMATHNNYKYANGDQVQRTDWHKICVFKPTLRSIIETHLKKGQRVLVTGKVSYGDYKGVDGEQKYVTAIIADNVIFFSL